MKALAVMAYTSSEYPHNFSYNDIAFSLDELVGALTSKLEKAKTQHLSLEDDKAYRESEIAFYENIIKKLLRPQGFLLGYDYNLDCQYPLKSKSIYCCIKLMTAVKYEISNYMDYLLRGGFETSNRTENISLPT